VLLGVRIHDLVADVYTFVADVNAWTGDELANVFL